MQDKEQGPAIIAKSADFLRERCSSRMCGALPFTILYNITARSTGHAAAA